LAKKKSILSLEQLRAQKYLSTPGKISCVPYRSDVLNLFTGGGVKFGHVTEISGAPHMFKSTLLAEVVGAALNMGAHVVIHDKERKLTAGRFASLGIKGADKSNPKFWYHEDLFPDYVLTLERMFEDMHEIWAGARLDDLRSLKSAFEAGEASAELCDRYAHLNPKQRPKTTDKKKFASWQKQTAKNLLSVAQLDDEDRTPIVWIVDSVTAIPGDDEAIDPTTGKPNLKPSIAANARIWSTQFRVCGFMDSKVASLHIAQVRTAGIGKGQAYKKAAVAVANEFYATNRIKIFPRAGGQLYRDPKNLNSIVIGSKAETSNDRAYQIGQIIMASIDKNLEGIRMTVPLYMLAETGTDVINSLFEFLTENKLVVSAGGYYTWDPDFWPERAGENFRREGFTDIYLDPKLRVELYQKLVHLKERIKHGESVKPSTR
jgi:RecA/RadA recombinase